MNFIKNNKNYNPLIDTVFSVATLAKKAKEMYGNENVVDATIGSLCDEEGNLVAFDSVFSSFTTLPSRSHARYASYFSGNTSFKVSLAHYLFDDIDFKLEYKVFATPGGTGALSNTISNLVNENDYILIPEIGWGSYRLMAEEFKAKVATYPLFENEHFALNDFKNIVSEILSKQDQLIIILNFPCHNPTGYSLTHDEWKSIIDFCNSFSSDKRIVLINDVAYMDYSYDQKNYKKYLSLFNDINENVCLIIAYSCSKTFTSYGLRLGAAILCHKQEAIIDNIHDAFDRTARAVYSNINNGAMENVSNVLTVYKEEFLSEKERYVTLLKARSEILLKEASSEGLTIYPYKEGFFITIKVDDDKIDNYHQALMDNNIFTVKTNHGIRVAICSLPVNKCYGLAKRMKDILDNI